MAERPTPSWRHPLEERFVTMGAMVGLFLIPSRARVFSRALRRKVDTEGINVPGVSRSYRH